MREEGIIIFGTASGRYYELALVHPVRKAGKLPFEDVEQKLRSSNTARNTLQIHRRAAGGVIGSLLVDDLIATGGTAAAAVIAASPNRPATVHGAAFLIDYQIGRCDVIRRMEWCR